MAHRYNQGLFKPTNPTKYRGNPTQIVYRSGWELKLMRYLDRHPDVKWWKSEEVIIPYRSPVDNKMHRYFVDFIVHLVNTQGQAETLMIEVKPKKQTIPPKKPKKQTQRFINEAMTYAVNQSKWEAARAYCAAQGWRFMIMTEDQLGIK